MENRELIVQVNIPFCFRKCAYCSIPTCDYDRNTMHAYTDAVIREIESVAEDMDDRIVTAIAVEGGCPGLMLPEHLQKIVQTLRKKLHVADNLFISMHTLPGEQSRSMLDRMGAQGVNHWIVSIPTTNDKLHYMLKRPYNIDAITMVDTAIRNFPMRDLSFEIMYGIPGQTKHQFISDLQRMMQYCPEHITLNCFKAEEGTELGKKIRSGEIALTDAETAAQMYCEGREYLKSQGYAAYTYKDFAIPGKENKYTVKKLEGVDSLGIGYHAVSFVDGVSYENGHNLDEYLKYSDDLSIIADNLNAPDEISMFIKDIYSGLSTINGVVFTELADKYEHLFNSKMTEDTFKRLTEEGIVEQTDKGVSITPYGIVSIEKMAEILNEMRESLY